MSDSEWDHRILIRLEDKFYKTIIRPTSFTVLCVGQQKTTYTIINVVDMRNMNVWKNKKYKIRNTFVRINQGVA